MKTAFKCPETFLGMLLAVLLSGLEIEGQKTVLITKHLEKSARARWYLREGKTGQGLSILESLTRKDPIHPVSPTDPRPRLTLLMHTYSSTGLRARGRKFLKTLVKHHPGIESVAVAYLRLEGETGNPVDALKTLAKMVKKGMVSPATASPLMARLHIEQGDMDSALRCLRNSLCLSGPRIHAADPLLTSILTGSRGISFLTGWVRTQAIYREEHPDGITWRAFGGSSLTLKRAYQLLGYFKDIETEVGAQAEDLRNHFRVALAAFEELAPSAYPHRLQIRQTLLNAPENDHAFRWITSALLAPYDGVRHVHLIREAVRNKPLNRSLYPFAARLCRELALKEDNRIYPIVMSFLSQRQTASPLPDAGQELRLLDKEMIRVLALLGQNRSNFLRHAMKNGGLSTRVVALDAIGFFREKNCTESLVESMSDPHPEIRSAALRALGLHQDGKALPDILVTLEKDIDPAVRAWSAWAASQMGPEAGPALIAARNDTSAWVRRAVIRAATFLEKEAAVAPLVESLEGESNPLIKERLLLELERLGEPAALLPLLKMNRAPSPPVSSSRLQLAISRIGRNGPRYLVPHPASAKVTADPGDLEVLLQELVLNRGLGLVEIYPFLVHQPGVLDRKHIERLIVQIATRNDEWWDHDLKLAVALLDTAT